ncbi:MAG: hypothetical protein JNL01_05430 [Bdellovibrionales bacterium]|nr:hypothetical protein [Bdellovibrionales bacterium]
MPAQSFIAILVATLTVVSTTLAPRLAFCDPERKPAAPFSPALARDPLQNLPRQPSAPPMITPVKKPNVIRCTRKYVYQGRTLDCDSNLDRDGEGLRPVLNQVPASIAELDSYQKKRKEIMKLSYAGGVGLLAILGGSLSSRLTSDPNSAKDLRTAGIASGVLILGVTLITGYTSLRSTQSHLNEAVKKYNDAKPGDPIELQFSTGVDF